MKSRVALALAALTICAECVPQPQGGIFGQAGIAIGSFLLYIDPNEERTYVLHFSWKEGRKASRTKAVHNRSRAG